MNLEPVIQSEVSQKEKNIACVCVCVCVCVCIIYYRKSITENDIDELMCRAGIEM